MYATQKQVIDSLVRVRAFVEAHPVTAPARYAPASETLDEVLRLVLDHAGTQVWGPALARAELRRQEQLIQRLMDQHMRPMVTTARAQIDPASDVRLPAALRMPRGARSVTKVLQACDGMITAAKPFESVLVANGLPTDFLARFRTARDELAQTPGARSTLIGKHVGARKGLQVQLRRGRRAVDCLDAVVRVAFEGDESVLTTWRAAKRVHHRSGGQPVQTPIQLAA